MMIGRRALFMLLMTGTLGVAATAAERSSRPRPPSLADLRGNYAGTYASTTHVERTGACLLKITFDRARGGARVLKGTVKLGRQNFGGLVGAFNPLTNLFQMTGRIGTIRRPRGAIVVAGRIAADAITLENATYTLSLVGQDEERGNITAHR